MLLNTLATTVATLTVGGLATAATVVGVTHERGSDVLAEELRVPCGAVWDRLPDDLQADLRALKAADPAQRPRQARTIRRHALAGDYGDRVQEFTEHRSEIRSRIWSRLPDELRDDLSKARALPPEQRAAAYDAIRDDALAGAYGERVQAGAERLAERRETCGDVTD